MQSLLYVVESFGGGVYTFIEEICKELVELYEVHIVFSYRPETPKDFINKFDSRISLYESKYGRRKINPLLDLLYLYEIKEKIRKISPDIVHFHSSKAGLVGRFATNKKQRRVFYTPHKYKFYGIDEKSLKYKVLWRIEKTGSDRFTKIITVSQDAYKASKGISKNLSYVNNGVNTDNLDIYKSDKKLDNISVMNAARACYDKNPEMFNKVAQEFPNIDFTWIGDGEESNMLKSSNIRKIGWINREDVLRELNRNTILLIPSRNEGLAIILLEAMYMGCIVIANDIPSMRTIIKDNYNGFLAKGLDDYSSVIKRIESNEIDLRHIRENASNDILKEYNVKVMSKRYIKLYSEEEDEWIS